MRRPILHIDICCRSATVVIAHGGGMLFDKRTSGHERIVAATELQGQLPQARNTIIMPCMISQIVMITYESGGYTVWNPSRGDGAI